MSEETRPPEDDPSGMSREEYLSALFANMVVQQTNMAMMFLGKVPHPETGQLIRDIDTARMFIDQLEMLQAKTKGNLSKEEEALLKQALASVQMVFVQAVGSPDAPKPRIEPPADTPPSPAPAPSAPAAEKPTATEPSTPAPTPDESRKKFSKKY